MLSVPPTRIPIGTATVGGQRVELFLNPEWARYFDSLNIQVTSTSAAVGAGPGAPGTTGAAGAGVSLSDDGGRDVEFIPGPPGSQGPQGVGAALFLLQDPPESQEVALPSTRLDETFIAPTLLNSWVNFDATTYNAAGFYKDSAGIVHLRGTVKSGVVGSAIFTLPAGYRPVREEIFACSTNNTIGRLDVAPTGDVTLPTGSNVYASLDGITFRAAGTY